MSLSFLQDDFSLVSSSVHSIPDLSFSGMVLASEFYNVDSWRNIKAFIVGSTPKMSVQGHLGWNSIKRASCSPLNLFNQHQTQNRRNKYQQVTAILITMHLHATVLATLFVTSSVLAAAIIKVADQADIDLSPALLNATESTAVEDGVPDFDPLELTGPPTIQDEQERDIDDEDIGSALEKRSAASTIVSCAANLKGTNYLYGGCKAKAPFGPAKGGLDCSCLSHTCIYKGTRTIIRKCSRPPPLTFPTNPPQPEQPPPNTQPKPESATKSPDHQLKPVISSSGVAERREAFITWLSSLNLVGSGTPLTLATMSAKLRSGRRAFAPKLFVAGELPCDLSLGRRW